VGVKGNITSEPDLLRRERLDTQERALLREREAKPSLKLETSLQNPKGAGRIKPRKPSSIRKVKKGREGDEGASTFLGGGV